MPTAFWANLVGAVQVVPEAQWLIDAPAKAWSSSLSFPTANSVHIPAGMGGGGVRVRFEDPSHHNFGVSALPGDRPTQLHFMVDFDTPWHTGGSAWYQLILLQGQSGYGHGPFSLSSFDPGWPADGASHYEFTQGVDWSLVDDLLFLEFEVQAYGWFGYTLTIEKLY
jgi:hypothetical protein